MFLIPTGISEALLALFQLDRGLGYSQVYVATLPRHNTNTDIHIGIGPSRPARCASRSGRRPGFGWPPLEIRPHRESKKHKEPAFRQPIAFGAGQTERHTLAEARNAGRSRGTARVRCSLLATDTPHHIETPNRSATPVPCQRPRLGATRTIFCSRRTGHGLCRRAIVMG
jgi:hypothetical protein